MLYCTDLYRPCSSKLWHGNRGKTRHGFRGSIYRVFQRRLAGQKARYSCLFWAHLSRCHFHQIHTALRTFTRVSRQFCGGTVLCCKLSLLAGNCIVAADKYFMKLIESLSLFGFPHIGVFPGICLNFCVIHG